MKTYAVEVRDLSGSVSEVAYVEAESIIDALRKAGDDLVFWESREL